jgi:hypothetical protein
MINNNLHWRVFPDQTVPWLGQGEILSDALSDLRTKDNALSVFEVGEDADEGRISVALAASREKVVKIEYAIFDDAQFAELGIDVIRSAGVTPDARVNEAHFNLQHLTVGHVVGLAEAISNAGKFTRKLPKEVKTGIVEAVNAGILDKDKMSPKLLDTLQT